MKIKTAEKNIEEVMALPGYQHRQPEHQPRFFRWLLKTLSARELKDVHFSCTQEHMDRIGSDTPCLVLMNHSSFIDLKIASTLLYPREFHIVCTADGFVGKEGLMRKIGCIPTFKFISDPVLVRDMVHTVRDLRASVLMYPEASYSFDGTATPLPDSLGKLLKILKVPVVMIRTYGAFARDPLYNNLQLRKVDVSAVMKCLLTPEEIREKTPGELNAILKQEFTFDNWAWQKENHVRITEPFRADGLHRVLYKCPVCGSENGMTGKGTTLSCGKCGAAWELNEYGELQRMAAQKNEAGTLPTGSAAGKTGEISTGSAAGKTGEISTDSAAGKTGEISTDSAAGESGKLRDGETVHVPDWYAWERTCVRKEIADGSYFMDLPVEIYVMVNTDAVYHVGDGRLVHSTDGFRLTGCGGKIDYTQSPESSYSLYSDYFWYEIGDMISIGTPKIQYYCFPKDKSANVAKARLAAEELFRMKKEGFVG